ncbi:MAG TPA: hypothetical protein VLM37_01435 [Fibrobacteraceae bacterium]|nr:hypothetical protein [Fibrobacteraceae bacterium]
MNPQMESWLRQAQQYSGASLWLMEGHPPVLRRDRQCQEIAGASALNDELYPFFRSYLDSKLKHQLDQNGFCRFRHVSPKGMVSRTDLFREASGWAAVLRPYLPALPPWDSWQAPPSVNALQSIRQGLILFYGPEYSCTTTRMSSFAQNLCATHKQRVRLLDRTPEWNIHAGASLLVQGVGSRSWTEDVSASLGSGTNLFLFGDIEPTDLEDVLFASFHGALALACLHASSTAGVAERLGSSQSLLMTQLRAIVGCHLIPALQGTGRLPAWDVLIPNSEVIQAWKSGDYARLSQMQQASSQEGSISFETSLAALVRQGRISPQEARNRVLDPSLWENRDTGL